MKENTIITYGKHTTSANTERTEAVAPSADMRHQMERMHGRKAVDAVEDKTASAKIMEWERTKAATLDEGDHLPMGYFAPGSDPANFHETMVELAEMRGRFTKPQLITFLENRCIHGRSRSTICRANSQATGCTLRTVKYAVCKCAALAVPGTLLCLRM